MEILESTSVEFTLHLYKYESVSHFKPNIKTFLIHKMSMLH